MSLHEIIPGTLWGAAGWLDTAAQPLTWLPPDARGFLPVTAYALRDGEDWMVLDTGLPAHWPALRESLARTVQGTTRRRMLNTRREQDCMANLHPLTREFGITEVPYVGVLNPVELLDAVEDAEACARIEALAPVRAIRIEVGEIVRIGRLRLEPLRVQLRLLATNWFWEHETRTLFTSDAFGVLTSTTPHASLVRAPEEPAMRAADFAQMMSAKFDWLVGIDPAPILADLDAVFAQRRIGRLCPGYGLVIEGVEAVAHAHETMREALHLLATHRRPAWRFPESFKTLEET